MSWPAMKAVRRKDASQLVCKRMRTTSMIIKCVFWWPVVLAICTSEGSRWYIHKYRGTVPIITGISLVETTTRHPKRTFNDFKLPLVYVGSGATTSGGATRPEATTITRTSRYQGPKTVVVVELPATRTWTWGWAQLSMATAEPDDNLALQLENTQAEQQTGRALRGQGSQSDTTDETLLGLQQDADLRGAVASAMGANPVGGSVLTDSSRRTNSPVERRLRELADSRNAVRNSLDPERSWSFGGARPRTRPDVERPWREDRGRYTSRVEAQIALSPRSAFNVNDEHGRFLAQRMERMEHGEDYRERMYRQDMREQTRRYEEDRLNWRRQQEQMQRQQDDMNRQMLQMQQQLAAMRLQTQQQQNQPQPPNMLPGPQLTAPLQQNQNPMPPPPNPPLQINPPPPPPQPPAQQPPPFQPMVASPAQWRLPPPQNAQPAAPAATPLGVRTPAGFTPRQINRTDDDYLFEDGRRRYDGIDRRNLKLRTFKGKDIDAWRSLFDDFAEQFQWTQAEKKLQLKTHVDDSVYAYRIATWDDSWGDDGAFGKSLRC